MFDPPFDLLTCSWPRPVEHSDGFWRSEPEWETPAMPVRPQPRWRLIDGELCWTIDWREFFRDGLTIDDASCSGEMRGFHIVSLLRVNESGTLVFWDDDGSVIFRNGELVHADKSAHPLTRGAIEVRAGDRLTVAQWQLGGDWLWGARVADADRRLSVPTDILHFHREAVAARLGQPTGPPLKIYCDGRSPVRTVVAVYSLIMNGYSPSEVLLYGEHQWSAERRQFFAEIFPFATVVPTTSVLRQIHLTRVPALANRALRHWFVFKACVGLLCPPFEFSLVDDDVFVLDRVDDALTAFRECDLVYTPDTDHTSEYVKTWGWLNGHAKPRAIGTFNAGLYWMRVLDEPRRIASLMLRVVPDRLQPWQWEQGLIANLFATRNVYQLPTQRYFYPLFDGLPGGMLGYDYEQNPCGFASIHFGGLSEKPSETLSLNLAPAILGRSSR